MLAKKTVFIVGAGASVELGLPIGEGLKPKIIEALAASPNNAQRSFASEAVEAAVMSYVNENDYGERQQAYERMKAAAIIIRKALPFALSIDQFLDSRRDQPEVVRMGKIGIAAAILVAERDSSLGGKSTGAISEGATAWNSALESSGVKSWHMKLVQLITAGKSRDQIAEALEEIAFIVFNYDRCLEQYIYRALWMYYNDEFGDVNDVIKKLNVIHPYGQVGYLHWQSTVPVVAYGDTDGDLRKIADSILTFTQSEQCGVADEVKSLIERAETVAIMGFGFLPQNVSLLKARCRSHLRRVFYTTKGVSVTDAELVSEDLEAIFGKAQSQGIPEFEDHDCYQAYQETDGCSDLMNHHWLRLTRAA